MASGDSIGSFYENKWKMTKRSIQYMKKGEVLANSTVESTGKKQSFSMKVAAIHKKKCSKVLRKLSLFESYKDWISFIKKSDYNPNRKLLTINANHTLLPFPMIVHVIVDRPTKKGVYPFIFPTGLFRGLKGEFIIDQKENKCLFFAKSHWQGQKKLPDFAIELFSDALTKLAGEALFRKIK